MNRITIYLFFLIFGLLANHLFAQEQQYFREGFTGEKDHYTKFDIYTSDDGLVNNDAKLVFQDQYGYMWFGTSDGLSKFDGYDFTNYQFNSKDSTSLSSSFITAIEEDTYGDLWIGTKNGLNKLNRAHGTFQRFYAQKGIINQLQDNYIKDLLSDSSGVLWIETYSGYLHKYNIKDSIIKHFLHPASENDIYFTHRLFKDGNKIWIFYRNKTCIFNIKEEKFEPFENRKINLINREVQASFSHFSSAIKDDYGNYYFGNVHSKGIVYNPFKQELSSFPFGSVYEILKTKSGQIYMGGYSLGLLQYDIKSNHFNHYTKSDDNPSSIASMQIWDIFEDKIGNIWFATPSGIGKLSPKKQKFQHVRHISNIKESIISNDVQDIIQTMDSNIWVATFEGISVLNKKKKSIETHQHDPKKKGSILSNRVKSLYQDKEETVWVGAWSGLGMDFLNKDSKLFKHYSISKEFNGYDWYIDFAEGNDELFVGVWGAMSLVKFNRNKFEMHDSYYNYGFSGKSDLTIIQSYQDYLFSDYFKYFNFNDNKSWAFYYQKIDVNFLNAHLDHIKIINRHKEERPNGYETINGELFAYTNYNLWSFDTINETFFKRLSIDQEINCIEKTREKNSIWIGNEDRLKKVRLNPVDITIIGIQFPYEIIDLFTVSDTIYVVTTGGVFYAKESILNSFNDFFIIKGLDEIKVNEILKIKNGSLCVSSDKGLYILNDDKTIKVHYTPENSNLSNDMIHDLFLDKEQKLWIGTQEGLNLFDDASGKFKSWYHDEMDPNTLSGNTIYSITERNGEIYVGTNHGHSILNLSANTVSRKVSADENSVQTSLTTCLLADYKGNIWIGNGSKGYSVDHLNTKTNKIKHYHDFVYDSTSYKGKDANFIFEDSKKNIWIGTDKGLNKFDSYTETFKLFSIKDGLPTNELMGMEEDDHGNYWLSSSDGLIKFNEEVKSFKHFTSKDGLSSNSFSQKASAKLYSGEIVFGSDKGLTIFHPDSIYPSEVLPVVVVSKMYIFDSLAFDDLSETQEIRLKYTENNFTIEFTVLDFISPEKNKYSYRLKGYDKEWINTGFTNRKAKYTTLPYGNYTFQLLASNHDGMWTKDPIELKIFIKPPLYRSLVAYVLYFLLFILLSILYGDFRIRRVKRQNRELEDIIKQRTEEVQEKTEEIGAQKISELLKESKLDIAKERLSGQEEERKRISRELHDGIGGHLTGIKLFLENLLEENENNELRLLLQDVDRLYIEVRNLSHDLLPPEFEETSIKEVLKLYVEHYVLRSQIEISISFHPKIKWNKVDQLVQIDIYRIVQELLQNAIKHSNAREIELEIVRHQEYIAIMVEDNGKGMQSFDERSGSGLKGLRSRLELISGKIFIDSQLGRGTIVNIELPFVFQIDNEQITNPLNI